MAAYKGGNPFEGWTTAEEAANIIGRARSTVQGWINQGVVTVHRVGTDDRIILVNVEELRRYSAENPPRQPNE